MDIIPGIELLDEAEGTGESAKKGDACYDENGKFRKRNYAGQLGTDTFPMWFVIGHKD